MSFYPPHLREMTLILSGQVMLSLTFTFAQKLQTNQTGTEQLSATGFLFNFAKINASMSGSKTDLCVQFWGTAAKWPLYR